MDKLVMIPGTLCNGALFQHQARHFESQYEVLVVDSSTSATLHDQAKEVLNSISGKFTWMGLSYGAMVGFEIIRQASERVKKLIILNSNHKKPSDQTRTKFEKFDAMIGEGRFHDITPDYLLSSMLYRGHLKNEALCRSVINMADSVGIEGFKNQVSAQLDRPDSSETLRNISCPTLIIAGEQDRICPVEWHYEMHDMVPRSNLEVINHCGHLSTMEQPEEVNKIIANWI